MNLRGIHMKHKTLMKNMKIQATEELQRKCMKYNGSAYEVGPIWNRKSQSKTGVGTNRNRNRENAMRSIGGELRSGGLGVGHAMRQSHSKYL